MKDFKERVLIPLLIPLGALAIIAVVVLNISRVLLALEERSGPHTVVAVAAVLTASVLFGMTSVASRGEERSGGNMAMLSVAGIMVIIAGFIGFEAIQEDTDKEGRRRSPRPTSPTLVTAFDLGFKGEGARARRGGQGDDPGAQRRRDGPHLRDRRRSGGKKLSVPAHGAKDIGTWDLKAGTYTYYCDIPGHRQAGMEGKITVADGAPAPGRRRRRGGRGDAGEDRRRRPELHAEGAHGAGGADQHRAEQHGQSPAHPCRRGGPQVQEAHRRSRQEPERDLRRQAGDLHALLRHPGPPGGGYGGEAQSRNAPGSLVPRNRAPGCPRNA